MAHIEKRTDTKTPRYRAKVVSGMTEDGRPRWISKTFGTRKEARDWAREREVSRSKGERIEPTREPLAQYARRFLDDVKSPSVRTRTYKRYRDLLRRWIEKPPAEAPRIGPIQLSDLRAEHVQSLYGWMIRERGLSPSTVKHLHNVLRQTLAYAERTGAVNRNVCSLVVLPKAEKPEVRAMSEEELGRFLRATKVDRYSALWFLLATTGMRPGEALGLKWEDVDLDGGVLRVQRALARTPGNGWELTAPKTRRSRRTIALAPSTVEVLREWKTDQNKARLKAGSNWEDHDLVFATTRPRAKKGQALKDGGKVGGPLDWANVKWGYVKVCAEAGIGHWDTPPAKPPGQSGPRRQTRFKPKYRAYALRHAHATNLLRRGVHSKVVSERLGHFSDGFTLDVYSASLESLQETAAVEMEEIVRASEAAG